MVRNEKQYYCIHSLGYTLFSTHSEPQWNTLTIINAYIRHVIFPLLFDYIFCSFFAFLNYFLQIAVVHLVFPWCVFWAQKVSAQKDISYQFDMVKVGGELQNLIKDYLTPNGFLAQSKLFTGLSFHCSSGVISEFFCHMQGMDAKKLIISKIKLVKMAIILV